MKSDQKRGLESYHEELLREPGRAKCGQDDRVTSNAWRLGLLRIGYNENLGMAGKKKKISQPKPWKMFQTLRANWKKWLSLEDNTCSSTGDVQRLDNHLRFLVRIFKLYNPFPAGESKTLWLLAMTGWPRKIKKIILQNSDFTWGFGYFSWPSSKYKSKFLGHSVWGILLRLFFFLASVLQNFSSDRRQWLPSL